MTALVPRNPTVKIDYAGTEVDLSPFTVAVDIATSADVIDVGTFETPKATETGKVTESITLAILWSWDMYKAVQPHIGEEGELLFVPDPADTVNTAPIHATVKFASMPWGRFEVGARVEADLVLAVLSEIGDTPILP
jgi:hypothetical protein